MEYAEAPNLQLQFGSLSVSARQGWGKKKNSPGERERRQTGEWGKGILHPPPPGPNLLAPNATWDFKNALLIKSPLPAQYISSEMYFPE